MEPLLILALSVGAAGGIALAARVVWWRGAPTVTATAALAAWDQVSTEYVSNHDAGGWAERHGPALAMVRGAHIHPHAKLRRLYRIAKDVAASREKANAGFTKRRLNEDKAWFDRSLGRPLADCQRLAVVGDEDNMLVPAGAGSGKTVTLVAKVAYLIRHGLAAPAEILIVAYNRKAQQEVAERLSATVGVGPHISTFHALGLRILREADPHPPRISPMVDQPIQRNEFLRACVRERLADPKNAPAFHALLTHALDESSEAPKTLDEAIQQLRAAGRVSLGGVKHKSLAEVAIANWLTLNGIAWDYEPNYVIPGARRQYRPDFQIRGSNIYIEHFGVDKQNRTAPWIDQNKYRADMLWKRRCHQDNRTSLVETFGYEYSDRSIFHALEMRLKNHGVRPRPLTAQEIRELVESTTGPLSKLLKALDQAVSLIRGNSLDQASLEKRCQNERDRTFLAVALWLTGRYEEQLRAAGEIDFDDMIIRAAELGRVGTWLSPWKYYLVDEFQDISGTRLDLIQALRTQRPDAHLYVVGDDWQSIYAFAGSNVGLIRKLDATVGLLLRRDLDVTFRFNQKLVDVSSRFVQENPVQLRRTIRSMSQPDPGPAVVVWLHDAGGEADELANVLEEIATTKALPAYVYLLGRYRHAVPPTFNRLQVHWESRGLLLAFLTIHASKGLEADFVIVLGLEQGDMGFPSSRESDPSMHVVLPDAEPFAHAEERRLFYVALTRAKRRAYVLGPAHAPSPFLDELATYPSDLVGCVKSGVKALSCPLCLRSSVMKRAGSYGEFWACVRHPLCEGKLPTCPKCKDGPLVVDPTSGEHRCAACAVVQSRCPRSGCKGYLIPRSGPRGPFLACSTWSPDGGCRFTKDAPVSSG